MWTKATAPRLGTISCGASTQRSYGSAPRRSTVSVAFCRPSTYGRRISASSAVKANRRSRSRGWGTTSSRGWAGSVPAIAASGAAASPASRSGMNTMGRSDRWQWRTVASLRAVPVWTARRRASAASVLTTPP